MTRTFLMLLALGLFAAPLAAGAAESIKLLTDIPGFSQINGSQGLPAFLNSLYRICIGAAVVIAILQLIRGGITWMLADSFTSKESARHSITIAIMGLVLVLSPYIVFSIINPAILDLSIADLGKLKTVTQPSGTPTTTPPIGDATLPRTQAGHTVIRGHFATIEEASAWLNGGAEADVSASGKGNGRFAGYSPQNGCVKYGTRIVSGQPEQTCVEYVVIAAPAYELTYYSNSPPDSPSVCAVDCIEFYYGDESNSFFDGCSADGGARENLTNDAPNYSGNKVDCPSNLGDLFDHHNTDPEDRGGACYKREYFCRVGG